MGKVIPMKRKLGDTSPPILMIIGEKRDKINTKYLLQKKDNFMFLLVFSTYSSFIFVILFK